MGSKDTQKNKTKNDFTRRLDEMDAQCRAKGYYPRRWWRMRRRWGDISAAERLIERRFLEAAKGKDKEKDGFDETRKLGVPSVEEIVLEHWEIINPVTVVLAQLRLGRTTHYPPQAIS